VELLGIALRVLGTNRSAHLLESWADSNALIAMPTIRRPTWEERISLKNAFVYKLNGAQRLQGMGIQPSTSGKKLYSSVDLGALHGF
jgi:hypothetical protein